MAKTQLPVVVVLTGFLVPLCGGLAQATSAHSVEGGKALPGTYIISLHQERVPVKRAGKVVSHKTTYSGTINVGSPQAQEFKVVFDTGSAHLILPAVECTSPACLQRRRYNMTRSTTGCAIKVDGSAVVPGDPIDEVTIGFGTGRVVGETVREKVCLGEVAAPGPCVLTRAIAATAMSGSSFEELQFDGILGLGLSSLALSKAYSVFDVLVESQQLAHPYFSVFLAHETGRESEIAIGGHNEHRLLSQFSWVPTVKPELGYWQVEIAAVRIDGDELDLCRDGTCCGILDSGTSHLGLPAAEYAEADGRLTQPAWDASVDCRLVKAPTIQLELRGVNLTLYPGDYMRPLPLSKQVMKRAPSRPPAADRAVVGDAVIEPEHYCRPKLMPVTWPPPMGPKVFIFGEVVLQRYYTAYDWSGPRAGFALANQLDVTLHHARGSGEKPSGSPRSSDEIMLMQVSLSLSHRPQVLGLAAVRQLWIPRQ